MKTLTLNYAVWRAGSGYDIFPHKNMIGKGRTRLLNKYGFMCCLGQFSLQCGFTKDEILNLSKPCELRKQMLGFNVNCHSEFGSTNTELSNRLMEINDDIYTTWQQKLKLISIALKEHDYELNVINTPEPINL